MTKFYTLEGKSHAWGDYYDILMHGMSCHLDRDGGIIQLERTGPFVPPISLPGIGDIVITAEFRGKLEASGLTGLHFQPVIKKLIVWSDWETWNDEAEENGFWRALGKAGKAEGLYWGGDWRSFKDWAHLQFFPNNKLSGVKKESGLA